jgi:hypothetical protein
MGSDSKRNEKPKVRLTGTDGNVFALAGLVSRALKTAGQTTEAAEFSRRLWGCESYDAALALMAEYCEVS